MQIRLQIRKLQIRLRLKWSSILDGKLFLQFQLSYMPYLTSISLTFTWSKLGLGPQKLINFIDIYINIFPTVKKGRRGLKNYDRNSYLYVKMLIILGGFLGGIFSYFSPTSSSLPSWRFLPAIFSISSSLNLYHA